MPKLLESNRISLDWSDIEGRVARERPAGASKRSAGVHLSGIIQHCLGLGKGNGSEDEEEFPLCMALGMAWEDWAVGLWEDLDWQPGEKKMDNVFASPDGKGLVEHTFTCSNIMDEKFDQDITELLECVEEFKATWQSRRTHGKDITLETKWMWQLAGYCHMMKLRYARLHVLWVCGEYKFGPPKPEYYTYLLQFEERELKEFWTNVVLKNRDSVKPEPGQ